jgi:hypothetical protein
MMDAKLAAQQAVTDGTVDAVNKALEKSNPSSATSKKPNRTSKRHGKRQSQTAAARLASLEAKMADQKEHTPDISIGQEDVAFVYTGKVAGKTAKVRDPFLIGKDVGILKPMLEPIVAVANGVLAGGRMDAIKSLSEDEFVQYTKSTPLDKAKYAYETLLGNPQFVEKLNELNEIIQATFQEKDLTPGRADVVAHDKRTHTRKYMSMESFRAARNTMDDGFASSSHDEQEGPDI